MSTITEQATRPANLIGSERQDIAGDELASINPAKPAEVVWNGSPGVESVSAAVAAARDALPAWRRAGVGARIEVLRTFASIAAERAEELGDLIMRETGKARWDAHGEAGIIAPKVQTTIDDSLNAGRARVTGFDLDLGPGKSGVALFKPHGVMAVVGPFNFPAHLPNGHIVPALMTGNTVVFKPSDKAPAVGQFLAELYRAALREHGFPEAVVNLTHGAAEVSRALVSADGVDGVLFTGSWPVGRAILEANLDRPGTIVALELGGNNPSVVMPDADLRRAAIEVARAAFITTGQRCTCTRRLIVHEEIAGKFVPLVAKIASSLMIGEPRGMAGEDVFFGPTISAASRDAVLDFQGSMAQAGATAVLESTAPDHPDEGFFVTPGICEVERFVAEDDGLHPGRDTEVFGPYLRVTRVDSLDDAIQQANATRYGLAASIFTASDEDAERFLDETCAGCINVNTGTAGASGKLPFGGVGLSGNHRPAGSFSPDYCAYPVASMREPAAAEPAVPPGMRFEDGWTH